MEKRAKVAVLLGGRSQEHEVSVMSAASVIGALREAFDVVPVGITPEGHFVVRGVLKMLDAGKVSLPEAAGKVSLLPTGPVRAELEGVDVVFPVLHGPFGEDGTVQGLLELAGIPYVGSGVLGSAVSMDKAMMKTVFAQYNIPMTPWRLVNRRRFRDDPEHALRALLEELRLPLFVKPANLGSSVGIAKVKHASALEEALRSAFLFDRRVVVEEGVDGRECECGVLGNDRPVASVVGEILSSGEFYDYTAKYGGDSRLVIPAELPEEAAEEIRALAVKVFLAVDAAGLARVDFFYTAEGRVLVNEINTMPGFTRYSMYPKLFEAAGMPYAELVKRLVELALERHAERT